MIKPIEKIPIKTKELAIRNLKNQIAKCELELKRYEDRPLEIKWYDRLHAWFNGKKTYIGFGLEGIGWLIPGPAGLILKCVGGLMIPIGIGHKVLKATNKTSEKGKFDIEDLIKVIIKILNEILKGIK